MKYEITKDLETGSAVIDSEHRQLFDAVNRLMDACNSGKGRTALEPTVKFLLDYVDKHFAHEEELQKQSRYPALAAHRQFHEGYQRKLREIARQIPPSGATIADVGAINQHVGLLITHIRTEDKKLGAYLRDKAGR